MPTKHPRIPVERGIVCIHPEPACWGACLQENRRAGAGDATGDLSGRRELLSKARVYTRRLLGTGVPEDNDTAVIGAGHQAIWHHGGIWAKTLVAARFARAVRAVHLHVVVDHDLGDTALVIPRKTAAGEWMGHREELEIDPRSVPLEMRESPPARQLAGFLRAVMERNPAGICADVWKQTPWPEDDARPRFHTVSDVITYLHALINERLGVSPELYLPVSELSASDVFLRFAGGVMTDATRFSSLYNEAVVAANPTPGGSLRVARPLRIDQEQNRAEVPFWLVDTGGRRLPLHVNRHGKGVIQVGTAARPLGQLDATSGDLPDQLRELLTYRGYRLRPRAVALTLFVRLTLVDWFVHGVGGAIYERIGDHLFEHYYHRRPPHMASATCTMILPQEEPSGTSSAGVGEAQRQLRAFLYQPERFLPAPTAATEPVATFIRLKQAAVSTARDPCLPHDRRKAAWKEIARLNRQLQVHAKPAADLLHQKLAEARDSDRSQQVRDSREYFFGLFPEPRLRALVDSVAGETFGSDSWDKPGTNSIGGSSSVSGYRFR